MAKTEAAISWLLTLAAVVVAGVLVHREFIAPPARAASPFPDINDPMTKVADWRLLIKEGVLVGDSAAPIMVVEFSDLECPFCQHFHQTLSSAREKWGDSIAYTFIHYPLNQHKLARPAARAAECALREGHFNEFVSAVFSKQDSLGTKSWASYAREASITDIPRFAACAADTTAIGRIESGLAVGALLDVKGTPTVIVNGWRFPVTPPDTQFRRVIADLLNGKEPGS